MSFFHLYKETHEKEKCFLCVSLCIQITAFIGFHFGKQPVLFMLLYEYPPFKAVYFCEAVLSSDLIDLDLNLMTAFSGLNDTVNNSLVVENLRSGNRSGTACLNSIKEGAYLLIE